MTVPTQSYDIAIVGAGLVGAALASLIASQPENSGLSIALIDQGRGPVLPDLKAQPPQFDPRVVALTPVSIALMENVGVWPQVQEQRLCYYRHMTVWDQEGTGEIHFDAADLKQPTLGAIVENSLLLAALLAQVEGNSQIDFLPQQTLDAIDGVHANGADDGEIKTLRFASGQTLQTRLLIAADGGNSRVRELVELPYRSWSYQQQAIVTTVETKFPHQSTARQSFLTSGPLAFLPLGTESQHYCSIVWSADTQRADQLVELSDQSFIDALGAAFEHRLGKIHAVDKRYSFPLVQRYAVDYFKQQVALVGDAAHTIHPLAGQGVNLGLQDAQALAAEISRASRRNLSLVDSSILRRYQRQRKRHNLEIMLLMESFKRLFGSRDLAVRWMRNTGLKTVNELQPVKNWLAKQAMGL